MPVESHDPRQLPPEKIAEATGDERTAEQPALGHILTASQALEGANLNRTPGTPFTSKEEFEQMLDAYEKAQRAGGRG